VEIVTAPDCLLCTAERITHWYYEDEQCWVADCTICSTPMVVWKSHGLPDEPTREVLLGRLGAVADTEYPEGWWLDGEMRKIPDHFHAHARPANGFFGRRKT